MSVRYWALSGNIENWETALQDNIWGVREGRLKNLWENISNGDILFFYCLSPVGGIIGFGKCQAKFKQDKPLWPDEIRENKVIYPYRWQFLPAYVLAKSEWKTRQIPLGGEIKIGYRAGLNSVRNRTAIDILNSKIKEQWKTEVIEAPISDFLDKAVKIKKPNEHARIKDLLINIGKVSGFMVEDEYKMDGQRLDVIWKKVEKGAPTYVFEVQIGGNITEALSKLKHAWDMWNSNIYLVIEEKDHKKADDLLSGTFHEIKNKLKVIPAERVNEFYKSCIAIEKMKENLGLP